MIRASVLFLLAAFGHVAQSNDYMFEPLHCNANLGSQPCESFTSRFSKPLVTATTTPAPNNVNGTNATAPTSAGATLPANVFNNEIIIPCGTCVTMDYTEYPTLELRGGIDVQGKLVFPDGYKINLETPYVRVQGELHMSSSKAPNGSPDVRFLLTGTSEQVPKFIPADNNVDSCGGVCDVGKKPIVVAGGRLAIEALPPNFPSWLNLYDVIPSTAGGDMARALVLSDTVKGKWGVGAEILITSHTLNYDQEQVREITAITDHTEAGYVVVELSSPILRPTTIKDSPDFAVEVALLARNVLFEGAKDDSNSRHGGHLMIFGTKLVEQKIEGVEVRNFGQQGNLGRYPIHFHLCDDNTGSVVSKNLVRESNQRCIVIHGTHNTLVEGNVAYDTAGHCYITEDGFEKGNMFIGNLGALTKRVERRIPDNGQNGEETDDDPSTFWMTSPTNILEGNVAAGSEDSGFWLELRREVRGPMAYLYEDLVPRYEPLTLFKDNVAHSNAMKGIRTYPFGYDPTEEAKFTACRCYRNDGDGIFFHNSHNLAVEGGIFADNREQLDLDNAEYVTVRNAKVIGISPQMRSLMQSQDLDQSPCQSRKVVGITLHTFTRMSEGTGAALENIDFTGFVNTGCEKAYAIEFDDEVRRGTFDYFSVVSNVSFEQGAAAVDLCEAKAAGITDVYLTDLGSDIQGATATSRNVGGGTSSIISEDSSISTFLPPGTCYSVPEHCYEYCPNTCMRTVTYKVDPTVGKNYKLRVCSTAQPDKCVEAGPTFYYRDEGDEEDILIANTRWDRPRYFAVHLPPGSYKAEFLGNSNWPTYVEAKYEDPLCSGGLADGAVDLFEPTPDFFECRSIIKNGNAESSPTDPLFWSHRLGGVVVAPGEGVDGSNALTQLDSKRDRSDAIVQYLDSRCLDLMKGRQYEIIAWIKLERKSGNKYTCDPDKNGDCPEIGLYLFTPDGSYEKQREVATVVQSSAGDNPGGSGYQLVHGVFEVTDEIADASRVMLYVQRNKSGVNMFIDNVSMVLVPNPSDPSSPPPPGPSPGVPDSPSSPDSPSPNSPDSPEDAPEFGPTGSDPGSFVPGTGSAEGCVFNGDLDVGDSRSWMDKTGQGLEVVSPGYLGTYDYALSAFEGGMEQDIRSGCLRLGAQYIVRAKFQLIDENGNYFKCNRKKNSDEDERCPVMRLKMKAMNREESSRTVAYISGESSSEGWNTLFGGLEVDEAYVDAETVTLQFKNVPEGMTLVVDEVSINEYGVGGNEYSAGTALSASIVVLGTILAVSLLQVFF